MVRIISSCLITGLMFATVSASTPCARHDGSCSTAEYDSSSLLQNMATKATIAVGSDEHLRTNSDLRQDAADKLKLWNEMTPAQRTSSVIHIGDDEIGYTSAAWSNSVDAEIGEIQPEKLFSKHIPIKDKTRAEFRKWGESLRKQFDSADPFPSLELASLLNETMLRHCVSSMTAVPVEQWTSEEKYPHTHKKHRLANSQWAHTPECKSVSELQANPFLTEFMKGLSGENDLIPKAANVVDTWTGHPLIGISSGGYLAVHSDYNVNGNIGVYRFLTMMLYLNEDWQVDHGGDLELFTQVNMNESACEAGHNPEIKLHHKVAPNFNKAFIWKNTPYAYHGHPTPIAAPNNRMRLALQFIWFTKASNGFPNQEAIFCVKCDKLMSTTCEPNNSSSVLLSTKSDGPAQCSSEQPPRLFRGGCVCNVK